MLLWAPPTERNSDLGAARGTMERYMARKDSRRRRKRERRSRDSHDCRVERGQLMEVVDLAWGVELREDNFSETRPKA
jgi:hypothetical protein